MARIRWGPRGRGDCLASVWGLKTKTGKHKTNRISWNYEERYLKSYWTTTRHWPQPRKCSASTTDSGPHRRFRTLSRTLEKSETGTLCRTCSVCCRPSDRWTWTWNTCLQNGSCLSRHCRIPRPGRGWKAGGNESWTGSPYQNKKRSKGFPRRLSGSELCNRWYYHPPNQENASCSVYNVYFTTGSRTQTGIYRSADHDARAAFIWIGIHHLHAYGFCQPFGICDNRQ